jgi:carboxylesterase type B
MASTTTLHPQLNATFNGTTVDYAGTKINKFKGIKYARIPARFEKAQPIAPEELSGKTIDATQYGYVYNALTLKRPSI